MSGWLSRAKGALSGRKAAVALEPINFACSCGYKVEATRRSSCQRVLCTDCGERFFLLPIDVYPRPVMKIRRIQAPISAETAKTKSPTKASTPTEVAPARPGIDLQAELTSAATRVRSQFTPLRQIVLSLLTVIGLTSWWQWNRAVRSSAEGDLKSATEAGVAALQKPDYVEAAQHFGRAAAAADILHRTDTAAEHARQMHRQLTAVNSLLTRSLIELIEAARATRLRENALAAESEFANLHAGRWLVMQSEITPPAGSATPAAILWEQRIQIFDESLVLTASLPAFAKIQATSPAPTTTPDSTPADPASRGTSALNDLGQREVLFAAQVESLKWNSEQSTWVLTLKSSSGFLWTDYGLLLAAGLPPDELHTEPRLRAMLTEQGGWIGADE